MRVINRTLPSDWEYATLYPISDVHLGAQECMENEFKKYIDKIKADDSAVVVLAGDMINNGIKSSVTNVYDEVLTPNEQKFAMVDYLTPIKDKIICMVGGNHERRTIKETSIDITQDLAHLLDIKNAYGGDIAFVKIQVGNKTNNKPAAYMFCVSHGAGGGMYIGSGLNRVENYQYSIEGVDGIITGHTHKPTKTPSARLIFDSRNNNIIKTKTLLFVCTSWLDYGGYAPQKLLRPTAFSPDTIILNGRQKEWK